MYRLEIISKIADARSQVLKKKIAGFGFAGKIYEVVIVDVYTISKNFSTNYKKQIETALINPVTQQTLSKTNTPKFHFAIEVGFLPGVTDNVGNTAREIIEDLLKIKFDDQGVYSSQLIFLNGKIGAKEAQTIGQNLINSLIQRIHIKSFANYYQANGMDKIMPRVNLQPDKKELVSEVNLNVSDEKLAEIGRFGIENEDGTRRGPLALSLDYMQTIKQYFFRLNRNPTDIELESIAQTWSEHCKHTIFADPIDDVQDGLFKTYIKGATQQILKYKDKKFCPSIFTDNSGAIEFDQDYLITHKVETHNSPSALDPFGGAITGIVGVNRDAIGFGLGAKPVINTYGFCFANPNDEQLLFKDRNLTQRMLSPRKILDGVVQGVNSGGNCSGIPTPQGFVFFDDSYKGKPLVFVGTVGLIPRKINRRPSYQKSARPGDYIVMVGGRVGLDGIHGATFSSTALDTSSPATAVQIGDPITQKKFSDALIKEARDLGLYNSITDNGAGGLSCSVAEMARESGGAYVDLEKVPLKYPGLKPWQIWISESQERMTLSVPKNKWKKFAKLMQKRGVEATIIGEFTKNGKCIVSYNSKVIMDLDLKFLHNGLPARQLKTEVIDFKVKESKLTTPKELNIQLLELLKNLNISSFEFISAQYDHEVQSGSVLKPLQGRGRINSEASVTKPVLDSPKGVVLSQGLYPTYSDPYAMAAAAIDTAIRNCVVAGADPNRLALLDNFCWCSSNDPKRLWQLKRACQACFDISIAYKTPFISGKDSMFNDFVGFDHKSKEIKISVLPTLLISAIGIVPDVLQTVSLDAKFADDLIYILGDTNDEMGGSVYFGDQFSSNKIPQVNPQQNLKLYQAYYKCVQSDLIVSGISLTRGGLGVALSKMLMGGMLGANIDLKTLPGNTKRDDFALFSESQGRILVAVNPKNKKQFEKNMKQISFAQIGTVSLDDNIIINGFTGKQVINISIKQADEAYKSTFRDY